MTRIVRKYLKNGQYNTARYKKESLFLHHTVSLSAESAIRWWDQTPERVGTPYVIDRDGTIYETFDPSCWAYHLGVKGNDNWQEKHSIGIELVSAGPLIQVDDEFRFYPVGPRGMYSVIHPEEVVIKKSGWRDYKIYQNYTEAQYEALKFLIPKLFGDFQSLNIQDNIESFAEYNPKIVEDHIAGVWSHSSVRQNKSDIVPFKGLIECLKEIREILSADNFEKD